MASRNVDMTPFEGTADGVAVSSGVYIIATRGLGWERWPALFDFILACAFLVGAGWMLWKVARATKWFQ
jgi:hypothetical protein